MHRWFCLGLAFWIAVAGSSWAAADDANEPAGKGQAGEEIRERVGVIVLAVVNTEPERAARIADDLRDALARRLVVSVISRADTRAAIGDSPPEGCVDDPACVRGTGKAMGADTLLWLAMVQLGDRTQIDVTWSDAATGDTETRDPIRLMSSQNPAEVLAREVQRLLPTAVPRPEKPDKPDKTDIPPPDRTPRDATPIATRGRHMTPGVWIAGGIGVAALATGAVFGFSALGLERELREQGSDASASDIESLDLRINIADGLYVTAAVAAVAAGILYWRSGGGPVVAVDAAPERVGLSVSGRF